MRTCLLSIANTLVFLGLLAALPVVEALAAPPGVEALIRQLGEKDESVRLKAAKELGKLKEAAADAIPALTIATKDADEDVRAVAQRSLTTIRQAVAAGNAAKNAAKNAEMIPPLIKDLQSKDYKVRLAAIENLEKMGPTAKVAGAAIVEYGMMSASPKVREAAFDAFEKIDPNVYKEVFILLVDNNFDKKNNAIRDLRVMGGKALAAIPVLKVLAGTPNSGFSGDPLYLLSVITDIAPDDLALQNTVLAYVASKKTSTENRSIAIRLMNKIPIENKQKYDALDAAFSSTGISTSDRVQIINEIAKLGADAKVGLPWLRKLRFDPNAEVRRAAELAVEAIRD
ncbi:MAG: HEAT repeat domain-containing protein [Planctomycetota bacterium]